MLFEIHTYISVEFLDGVQMVDYLIMDVNQAGNAEFDRIITLN